MVMTMKEAASMRSNLFRPELVAAVSPRLRGPHYVRTRRQHTLSMARGQLAGIGVAPRTYTPPELLAAHPGG